MTIEVRTCPKGHVHKYLPDDDTRGTVVAYYCATCCEEYKPAEMKIIWREGSYSEVYK